MTFGEQIKHVRMKLNMSQEMLARELQVSFATVNRWENGKSEPGFKAKQIFENFCKEHKIGGE